MCAIRLHVTPNGAVPSETPARASAFGTRLKNMMMLLLRAFAVVWVAAAAKHPHNEALKVADYVREVRDQLHNDGQPAAAAPSGKGWPDAAAKAAAMERIAAAAEERRLAIRRHYGLEGTPDAERWLDEAIGFTKEEAKAFTIEKLRAAVERGGPLRIGVMGISVTAGHDCHYNQSFPLVFARHFGRALDAGGVELVMRNHAIGGFGVMPSHFCTQTMVGADNDVVAWDYQMMAPRFDCRVEQWARAFALSAAQPAMLYWQGGLYLAKDGTLKEKDLLAPSKNDKQSCGNRWVVNGYASVGAHWGNMLSVVANLRYKAGLSILKDGTDPLFMDPLKGKMPSPDYDEPHRRALAANATDDGAAAASEPGRRRLARHHPGPALHRLWGLAWAHAYLGLLAQAMRAPAPDADAPARRDLPPVMGCAPRLCKEVVPQCATTVLPRVGGGGATPSSLEALITSGLGEGHWKLINSDTSRAIAIKTYGRARTHRARARSLSSARVSHAVNRRAQVRRREDGPRRRGVERAAQDAAPDQARRPADRRVRGAVPVGALPEGAARAAEERRLLPRRRGARRPRRRAEGVRRAHREGHVLRRRQGRPRGRARARGAREKQLGQRLRRDVSRALLLTGGGARGASALAE